MRWRYVWKPIRYMFVLIYFHYLEKLFTHIGGSRALQIHLTKTIPQIAQN